MVWVATVIYMGRSVSWAVAAGSIGWILWQNEVISFPFETASRTCCLDAVFVF